MFHVLSLWNRLHRSRRCKVPSLLDLAPRFQTNTLQAHSALPRQPHTVNSCVCARAHARVQQRDRSSGGQGTSVGCRANAVSGLRARTPSLKASHPVSPNIPAGARKGEPPRLDHAFSSHYGRCVLLLPCHVPCQEHTQPQDGLL